MDELKANLCLFEYDANSNQFEIDIAKSAIMGDLSLRQVLWARLILMQPLFLREIMNRFLIPGLMLLVVPVNIPNQEILGPFSLIENKSLSYQTRLLSSV